MSYSFGLKRANKDELQLAMRDEFAKVPETQPVHKADIDQAFNAAQSLLVLMQDDPARDVACSISGSIWATDAGAQQVSLSINFNLSDRAAEAVPATGAASVG